MELGIGGTGHRWNFTRPCSKLIAAFTTRQRMAEEMVGYRALMLGLRHPEMFCSIGSHSGAIRYAADARNRIENPEETPEETPNVRGRREPSSKDDKNIGIEGFGSQVDRYLDTYTCFVDQALKEIAMSLGRPTYTPRQMEAKKW